MVANRPNGVPVERRTAWSALRAELRDEPVYLAAYKFAKEVLSESIRQIPIVGPLIAGGLAAAESLAGTEQPDQHATAVVEALLQAHGRELAFRDQEIARRDEQLAARDAEVRSLTQAVQDLANRARAPDAPAEIIAAEAAIETGDPTRARTVYAAIWQREAGRANAANRTAARAARYVAALDALTDTAKALIASESATELDSHDPEAWVLHASLLQRAGRTDAARDAYRRALDLADPTRDPAIVLIARGGLGDVAVIQGDLSRAGEHFGETLTITKRLVDERPEDQRRIRNLSVSLNKIGDVQRARGDLDAALKAYEDSHAIREQLAAQDPSNSGWQ